MNDLSRLIWSNIRERKWELVGNNYGARVGDRYVYVKYTFFKCPVSVFHVPVKFLS